MSTHASHKKGGFPVALTAVLQLVGTVALGAQEITPSDTVEDRAYARFVMGARSLQLADLNERLANAGLTRFDEDFLSLGGLFLTERHGLLFGVEGHLLLGSEGTENGRTSSLLGGIGQLDLGYRLYSGHKLSLTPVIGLGGGVVGFDIARQDLRHFDDVILDPGGGSRLESSGALADISLGLDYRIPGPARQEGTHSGLAVGLRLGYALPLGSWDWAMDGRRDVTSGPDVAVEGFHLAITLGGWSHPVGNAPRLLP